MAGKLQPLAREFPIVGEDGKPTDYFIRWAQQKQIEIAGSISVEEAEALILADLTARHVIGGTALTEVPAGGSLVGDVTVNHNDSPVTPGTYGSSTKSAVVTVDQQGHLTAVTEATISGGGGGGGSYSQLDQHITATLESTITFASINQSYRDLIIVAELVTQSGAGADSVNTRINSDTGNNYNSEIWNHYGLGNYFGVNYLRTLDGGGYIGPNIPVAAGEYTFYDYTKTVGQKRMTGQCQWSGPSDLFYINFIGQWFPATPAAITQLDFYLNGGSQFDVGTVFTLYGRGT